MKVVDSLIRFTQEYFKKQTGLETAISIQDRLEDMDAQLEASRADLAEAEADSAIQNAQRLIQGQEIIIPASLEKMRGKIKAIESAISAMRASLAQEKQDIVAREVERVRARRREIDEETLSSYWRVAALCALAAREYSRIAGKSYGVSLLPEQWRRSELIDSFEDYSALPELLSMQKRLLELDVEPRDVDVIVRPDSRGSLPGYLTNETAAKVLEQFQRMSKLLMADSVVSVSQAGTPAEREDLDRIGALVDEKDQSRARYKSSKDQFFQPMPEAGVQILPRV